MIYYFMVLLEMNMKPNNKKQEIIFTTPVRFLKPDRGSENDFLFFY